MTRSEMRVLAAKDARIKDLENCTKILVEAERKLRLKLNEIRRESLATKDEWLTELEKVMSAEIETQQRYKNLVIKKNEEIAGLRSRNQRLKEAGNVAIDALVANFPPIEVIKMIGKENYSTLSLKGKI